MMRFGLNDRYSSQRGMKLFWIQLVFLKETTKKIGAIYAIGAEQ